MKPTTIDFGTFTRPDGETTGRLVLNVSYGGAFSLDHMVTPHEGTILATGHFHGHVSKEFADLAIQQIANCALPAPRSYGVGVCDAVETFQQEFLGQFPDLTPEERKLRELAQQYIERTEAYDRTVCTGPITRGEIMPASIQEGALINRNARKVHDELMQDVWALGFLERDFMREIRREIRIRKEENTYTPNA